MCVCVWLMTFAHKTETLPSDKLLPILLSVNVISFVVSVYMPFLYHIHCHQNGSGVTSSVIRSHSRSLSFSFPFPTFNFSSHLVCASRTKSFRKYYFVFIIHPNNGAFTTMCYLLILFLLFQQFGLC